MILMIIALVITLFYLFLFAKTHYSDLKWQLNNYKLDAEFYKDLADRYEDEMYKLVSLNTINNGRSTKTSRSSRSKRS